MGTWALIGPTGAEVSLDNLGVNVRETPGAGMPPLEHITLRGASEPQISAATWREEAT